MAFCDVCKHRVYDIKQHLKTEEHRRNLRRIIGMGLLPCPHCGGRLYWDKEDKEWRCLNCARQPERPISANDNSISGKKIPISTDSNPISTTDKVVSVNKNPVNVSKNPFSTTRNPISANNNPITTGDNTGHSLDGVWWPPGKITFRRRQMLFLIKHLPQLREGYWPANPAGSSYVDLPMIKKGRARRHHAYFEIPSGIAGEVEYRLEKCGMDGLVLEATECWEKSEQSLAKYLGISPWSIRKRANNALRYVSGWERKKQTYKEFINLRKVKVSNSVNF